MKYATQDWWRAVPRTDSQDVETRAGTSERVTSVPFIALLAFTVILILAPQDHFGFLRPLHLAFVAAVVAGATYLYERLYRKTVVTHSRELVLVMCLLGLALASVPFSFWPGGSVGVITNIFLKAIIICWLLARVVTSVERLKIVAWTLTLISIFLTITAIRSFHAGGGFTNSGLASGMARISGYDSGLTSNPNDLALMINLILPLTLALIGCTRSLTLKGFLVAVAGLDVVAVMVSYSRAGFLMTVTILALYLFVLWRRRKYVLVSLALVGALALPALLTSSYADRISTIANIQSDPTGSAQQRWEAMKSASVYIYHHPVVGAGIGMSELALNQMEGPQWVEVHDVYLQYAMDMGLAAGIVFLLLLYELLKSCRYARRIASARRDRTALGYLADGLWICLVGFAVAAIFYPDAYEFYFFYFAGLIVGLKAVAYQAEKSDVGELGETRVRA